MPKDDFFDIDKNDLDTECQDQPKSFHRYAKKLASARRDAAMEKAALKVAYAELDLAVRKRPQKFGLDKLTEGAIESVILTQQKHKDAIQKLIEADHTVDVLEAAVETMRDRKKELENLVQLRLADYYSEPHVRSTNGITDEAAKRRARSVGRE